LYACEDKKIVRWCRTQASKHTSQGVVDGRATVASVSTAAPEESSALRLNVPEPRWLFATLLLQHPSQTQQAASRIAMRDVQLFAK